MKKHFAFLAAALMLTGCVSTVTTYDAQGKVTGKCESQQGFIIGAIATCSGYANDNQEK